jgi:hypothetical protein
MNIKPKTRFDNIERIRVNQINKKTVYEGTSTSGVKFWITTNGYWYTGFPLGSSVYSKKARGLGSTLAEVSETLKQL